MVCVGGEVRSCRVCLLVYVHIAHVMGLLVSIRGLIAMLFPFFTSKVTAPQDAHRRLVLQVYLGLNTLEFSAIRS